MKEWGSCGQIKPMEAFIRDYGLFKPRVPLLARSWPEPAQQMSLLCRLFTRITRLQSTEKKVASNAPGFSYSSLLSKSMSLLILGVSALIALIAEKNHWSNHYTINPQWPS